MPSLFKILRAQKSRVRDFGAMLVRAARTSLSQVDSDRWRRVGKETPIWDDRNRLISAMIPPNTSLVDIGCGAQTLKKAIDPSCRYQAVDVVEHEPAVWVWNFNKGPFPRPEARFDLVICSGVLEYVDTPRAFLSTIGTLAPRAILSFSSRDDVASIFDRRAAGWINDMSTSELRTVLDELGIGYRVADRWREQTIYDLDTTKLHKPSA